MTTESKPSLDDFTNAAGAEIPFECTMCDESWSPKTLPRLGNIAAWHWNKEHGNDLKHDHERIDTVERGGHHLHENRYSVERIPIYITAFDILENLGTIEGHVRPADGMQVCTRCMTVLDPSDDFDVVDEIGDFEQCICADCQREKEIERRREENVSLDAFARTTTESDPE